MLDVTDLKNNAKLADPSKVNFFILDNPLAPETHIHEERDVEEGAYLYEYLGEISDDWLVVFNGKEMSPETLREIIPSEGDLCVLAPIPRGDAGKQILQVILLVILTYYTFGAGGGALFGLEGAALVAAQAAVFIGGAMLINAILPMTPDEPEGYERGESYGIDGPKNTARSGVPIPIVIGPYRVGGNYIAVHNTNGEAYINGKSPDQSGAGGFSTETEYENYGEFNSEGALAAGAGYSQGAGFTNTQSEQFLYLLLNAGEGPVDGIGQIYINDNPIENFEQCEWTLRKGVDNQELIPGFNKSIVARNQNVGMDTQDVYTTRSTVDPCDSLRVDLLFPGGFYRQRSDGTRDPITLNLNIEYKEQSGSTWYNFNGTAAGGTVAEAYSISRVSTDPVRMSFHSIQLPQGDYDVRIKRDAEPAEKIISQMIWTDLNEINNDPMGLNYTVLLGIKVRVDAQINRIPKVTYDHAGIKLRNYDETTGLWQVTRTNNPAWVVWNIFTNVRWGGGIDESQMDEYAFREWAEHCTEQGYKWVGTIDRQMSLWDSVKPMLRVGHAQLVRVGNSYSVNIEKAKEPSQLFNSSNIKEGSFVQSWLPLEGRANEVHATYFDKDEGYKPKVAKVVDQAVQDKVEKPIVSKITYFGIDNLDQAQKEAQFELNVNNALVSTAKIEVPMEAITASVGDVVAVQHDQPEWGQGGRVEDGSTTTSIVLDREVEKTPGTFQVLLSYDSLTRYSNTISGKSGNILTITGLDWTTFSGNPDRLTKAGQEVRILRKVTQAGDDAVEVTDATNFSTSDAIEIVELDAMEIRDVTSPDGTYTTIATNAFPAAPAKGDKWVYGPLNQNAVNYTIRGINQTSDFDASLDLLEYNENVFNVVVGTTVPPASYDTDPLGPVTFEVDPWSLDTLSGALNTNSYEVTLSWTHPSYRYKDSEVWISRNGQNFKSQGFFKDAFTMLVQKDDNLIALVNPRSTEGTISALETAVAQSFTVTFTGTLEPPPDPINFATGTITANEIELTWGDSTTFDQSVFYEIAVKEDTANDLLVDKIVENADYFEYVSDLNHYTVTKLDPLKEYTFWIRSVRVLDVTAFSPWVGGTNGLSATTLTDKTLYYIKATNGVAIQNGAGTLTLEARVIDGGVDSLVSSGTIKLYVGATEVTVANGYDTGSDGYTGVFDSGDINGSVLVELKDGPAGAVLDAQRLIDVTDGVDAKTFALTDSNVTLPSASDGTGYTLPTNPVGTFIFFDGTTDLTGDPSVSYSIVGSATKNGLTMSLPSSGQYSLSGASPSWTSDKESWTLRATYDGVDYDLEFHIQKAKAGVDATGDNAELYYIKPVDGTAIKNGTGTITVEARFLDGSTDTLLSAGTIKLFVGATEVTLANGYAAGSDGYTGVFDAGDISDSVIVELKDGSGGTVLDSITLVDIADGGGTVGFIEPSNGLAYTRAVNSGAWTPATNTTDLVAKFYEAGSQVATETRRVTLDTANGTFTEALEGANDANINVSVSGSATSAITIEFTHVPSSTVVAETVISAQSGTDGDPATQYYIKPVDGTGIKNSTGQITLEARFIDGGSDTLLSAGTIQLFDPSNNALTVANGYATGSDGYTGVLDSDDINDSIVITLKDGTGGTPLDTITVTDVTDGSSAVSGFVTPSNGLAYTRAVNEGGWTPASNTTDLVFEFWQQGAQVATETRRVTLNTSTGNLTEALEGTTDPNIGISTSGSGTSAITITATHTPSSTVVAETVLSSQSGIDGRPGIPGASTIISYDDLQETANVTVAGQYKYSTNADPSVNGTLSWSTLTNAYTGYLHLHQSDTALNDNEAYFQTIESGDIITWFDSERRWLEWQVTSAPTDNGTTWTFPISLVEYDEADGSGDIPFAAANSVEFRFSRGQVGSQGPQGDSSDIVFARTTGTPTVTGTTNPPTGNVTWYGTVAETVGTDPLWSSFGSLVGGSTDWSWNDPVPVEATDGDPGLSVAELQIFIRSAASPTLPSSSSFTFPDSLTVNNGWTQTMPADDGNPIWASRAVASIQGTSGTDNTLTWSTPIEIGVQDGISYKELTIYKNQAANLSAPSAPTNSNYSFATDTLTINDAGWSETNPDTNNATFTWAFKVILDTSSYVDGSTISWGAVILAFNGGVSTEYIWKRSATAPATPANTDLGVTPAGWEDDPGDTAGSDPLYFSVGEYDFTGVKKMVWSTPVKQEGTQGIQGDPGDSVDIVFGRSAAQPTATGTTNPPGGSITWYSDVNSVPAGSNPIWSSVGTSTDGGTTWSWDTPIQIEGSEGAEGQEGLSVAEVACYVRSGSAPATPTNGTFNFATQTLTPPSTPIAWFDEVPEGVGPAYMCKGIAATGDSTATSVSVDWGTPSKVFEDGRSAGSGLFPDPYFVKGDEFIWSPDANKITATAGSPFNGGQYLRCVDPAKSPTTSFYGVAADYNGDTKIDFLAPTNVADGTAYWVAFVARKSSHTWVDPSINLAFRDGAGGNSNLSSSLTHKAPSADSDGTRQSHSANNLFKMWTYDEATGDWIWEMGGLLTTDWKWFFAGVVIENPTNIDHGGTGVSPYFQFLSSNNANDSGYVDFAYYNFYTSDPRGVATSVLGENVQNQDGTVVQEEDVNNSELNIDGTWQSDVTATTKVIGNKLILIEKTGAYGWNTGWHSKRGSEEGLAISFRPDQTNENLMVGINTDPGLDNGYLTIDYMFYVKNNGQIDIRKDGISTFDSSLGTSFNHADLTTYDTESMLAIVWDGYTVYFYKNGNLLATVDGYEPTGAVKMDSSWASVPAGTPYSISNVQINQATTSNWVKIPNVPTPLSNVTESDNINNNQVTTFEYNKPPIAQWSALGDVAQIAGPPSPYQVTITWRDGDGTNLGTTVIEMTRSANVNDLIANAHTTVSNSAGATISLGGSQTSTSTASKTVTSTATLNGVEAQVSAVVSAGIDWSFLK